VEFGFHATPTSKIAKEAGVANGTLFHYYKTKDELIVALYVHIKTRLAHCIQAGADNGLPVKERCRAFYITGLQWGLSSPVEFRFVQQFMGSPYVQMIPEEMQKHNLAITNLIKEGIKQKLVRQMPVEYIQSLFASHLFGVSQYIISAKLSAAERKKLIGESFEMIWKMISA